MDQAMSKYGCACGVTFSSQQLLDYHLNYELNIYAGGVLRHVRAADGSITVLRKDTT